MRRTGINADEFSRTRGKIKGNAEGGDFLSPSVDDFTMAADNEYGWPPLVGRIARRYDVDPNCGVLAHGNSMANHVACAVLLESAVERSSQTISA